MLEVLRSTWAGLAAPRRLVPILLVALPMLWAQVWFTPGMAPLALGAVFCVSFVLVAPVCWRALFPLGQPVSWLPLRALAYGLAGVVTVLGIGFGLRTALGLGSTFLSASPSLLIVLTLFWVGGWGLGRDIDLELSLAREKQRADALAREAEHAELMAIRSNLDPHFLFNTLNAIAEWCAEDPAVAERALLELSGMLRTVLAAVREPLWPMQKELELTEALFFLYQIRDSERFKLEKSGWELAGDWRIPPMLLLALSENALKHGPAAGHEGMVRVALEQAADGLRIVVENPGSFAGPRPGGEGLRLVERRLALAFQGAAQLSIEGQRGWTRAELLLPQAEP